MGAQNSNFVNKSRKVGISSPKFCISGKKIWTQRKLFDGLKCRGQLPLLTRCQCQLLFPMSLFKDCMCCYVQTQWAPIPDDNPPLTTATNSSSPGVVLPDVNNTTPTLTAADTQSTCPPPVTDGSAPRWATTTPVEQRANPLPVFAWADSRQMWESMMSKEELPGYRRDSSWFTRHQLLEPRMRTILLDWLMEVESSLCLCKVK